MLTTGVRDIELAKSDGVNANAWETISTIQSEDTDGEFQRISFRLTTKITAMHLRLKVIKHYIKHIYSILMNVFYFMYLI